MSKLLKKLLSYFPTALPTGMTELNQWLDDVVELAGPIADRDSVLFVACHECIYGDVGNLRKAVNKVSKHAVVKKIRYMAAKQCMSKILMDINERHEAAKSAANINKEATATTNTPSADKTETPAIPVQ